MPRHRLVAVVLVVLIAAVALVAAPAPAQEVFPGRPVTLVVGFAPGGGADVFARALAEAVKTTLPRPLVVENRPGAGGTNASAYVMSRPADGYTLLFGHAGSTILTPVISGNPNLKWSAFEPVARVQGEEEFLFVRPDGQWKTIDDLVGFARQNPSKLRVGGSAVAESFVASQVRRRGGARTRGVVVGRRYGPGPGPSSSPGRLGRGLVGYLKDSLLIQIALGGRRRPDMPRLVGQVDVKGVTVEFRVDGDRPDPQLAGGADHPHRDLSAVGNQEAFDHCGPFPCFFGGSFSRLVRRTSIARISFERVSLGSITASTRPSSSACRRQNSRTLRFSDPDSAMTAPGYSRRQASIDASASKSVFVWPAMTSTNSV